MATRPRSVRSRRRGASATAAREFDALSETQRERFRLEALRLFARERGDVDRVLVSLEGSPDPVVGAAMRRIAAQYSPGGLYHRQWLGRYLDLIGDAYSVGGRRLAADVSLDFSLRVSPRVVQAVRRRASGLAEQVGRTTARGVTAAVSEGLRNGEGARAIRDRILSGPLGVDLSLARADRIARTEVHGALVEGEYVTALESGVFRFKRWLSSGNRRNPRDWHAAMDGERRRIDEPFSNGLQVPGEQGAPPEEVVNCGCLCEYED